MPGPYHVPRQDDSHSCGFFALAAAVRLKDPNNGTKGEMLRQRSPEITGRSLPRVHDSELNSVLSSANLNYKVTRPMAGDQPMPLLVALRSKGPDGVFIAKAKAKISDNNRNESTDYHIVTITDYVADPGDPNKDRWTVLCSATGQTVEVKAEHLGYAFYTNLGKPDERTFLLSIESCQVFEPSKTPGGRAEEPTCLGFFKDLFSSCFCCGGKED